jgi:hypothetical protein
MKVLQLFTMGLMIAFGQSAESSVTNEFSSPRRADHAEKAININRRLSAIARELRDRRLDLKLEQKTASEDFRRDVREETGNITRPVRQEVADSLERARLQAREQTRKLAEEAKAVSLNRTGM